MFDIDDHPLLHGERLLIRTVRLLALGPPCHGGRGVFEAACACGGEAAYRTLEVFLQQVALRGRRRLTLSMPVDPRLTCDEAVILQIFAAAQADDYRTLYRGLVALLDAPPAPAIAAVVCQVADTLSLNGLLLRLRPPPADTAFRMAAE